VGAVYHLVMLRPPRAVRRPAATRA